MTPDMNMSIPALDVTRTGAPQVVHDVGGPTGLDDHLNPYLTLSASGRAGLTARAKSLAGEVNAEEARDAQIGRGWLATTSDPGYMLLSSAVVAQCNGSARRRKFET